MPTHRKPLGPDNISVTQGNLQLRPTPCSGLPLPSEDPRLTLQTSLALAMISRSAGWKAAPASGPRQRPALEAGMEMGRGAWRGGSAPSPVSVSRCGGWGVCPPSVPLLPLRKIPRSQSGESPVGKHCFCWVTWDCDLLPCALGGADSLRGRESGSEGVVPLPLWGAGCVAGTHFLYFLPRPFTQPCSLRQPSSK